MHFRIFLLLENSVSRQIHFETHERSGPQNDSTIILFVTTDKGTIIYRMINAFVIMLLFFRYYIVSLLHCVSLHFTDFLKNPFSFIYDLETYKKYCSFWFFVIHCWVIRMLSDTISTNIFFSFWADFFLFPIETVWKCFYRNLVNFMSIWGS